MKNRRDYEVGYGRPPVKTRFQKGQSGNPSGRSKKIACELQPGKILQLIDNEEILVSVEGRLLHMLKAEIFFQQLFNKAIKGNLSAARLVANMAKKYFGHEAGGAGETRFIVVPDHELLNAKGG